MTVAMTLAEMAHHTAPRGLKDDQGRRGGGAGRARSPTGTEDTTSGVAAGCSERARAAAGFRARGVPVLLSAVAGHAVSGGCDGRRGGLRLRPFPRGFCVGGQKEGGGGGAGEEYDGDGAVARCASCSPDAGAEAQDRRDLRRVSGLSLPPAGEKEEEEEEEEKASSVFSSTTRLSTSL